MRKNILITGASSGLGMGMAKRFAAKGSNLALCARRVDSLMNLKTELEASHPGIQVLVKPLDVNNHQSVFDCFDAFQSELGSLDRIVVNAGIGNGGKIGTGEFTENLKTAETNFVAAVAQCEAAMKILREQNQGHLVTISSLSAFRGMRGSMAVYAATKAGLASLTEGIRMDVLKKPIKVTTIFPGYILTAINEEIENAPFRVDLETGCDALVKAIEREPDEACVPGWPWTVLAYLMKRLPLKIVAKLT